MAKRTGKKVRNKQFQKAGNSLFASTIQRAGLFAHIKTAQRLDVVKQVFSERFGEGFDLHAQPTYIKNKTLGVEVVHPAIHQHILEQQEPLIRAINAAAEEELIERLHVQLKQYKEPPQ